MNIVTFLIVGLLAGWMASTLVKGEGSGMLSDIVIGVIGAFVGGFIFNIFGVSVYSFPESIIMSVIGAIVFLVTIGVFYKRHYNNKFHV